VPLYRNRQLLSTAAATLEQSRIWPRSEDLLPALLALSAALQRHLVYLAPVSEDAKEAFEVTANIPELDIFRPFNLTCSRQDLQEMGWIHGISKVVRSQNNAKGTCPTQSGRFWEMQLHTGDEGGERKVSAENGKEVFSESVFSKAPCPGVRLSSGKEKGTPSMIDVRPTCKLEVAKRAMARKKSFASPFPFVTLWLVRQCHISDRMKRRLAKLLLFEV